MQYYMSNPHSNDLRPEHTYKSFPVRTLGSIRPSEEAGGWLTEYRSNITRSYKSVPNIIVRRKSKPSLEEVDSGNQLTVENLLRISYVDKPSDVCKANLRGLELRSPRDSDFSEFVNATKIDASDNILKLETFRSFPSLIDLELQLNRMQHISSMNNAADFPNLERLDLSYNSLSGKALLALGKLKQLRILILVGCSLNCLPPELARSYKVVDGSNSEFEEAKKRARFPMLEELDLSSNELLDISTFASLAGLKSLQRLNLSHNLITCVPHLRLMVSERNFSAVDAAVMNSNTVDAAMMNTNVEVDETFAEAPIEVAIDIQLPMAKSLSAKSSLKEDTNAAVLSDKRVSAKSSGRTNIGEELSENGASSVKSKKGGKISERGSVNLEKVEMTSERGSVKSNKGSVKSDRGSVKSDRGSVKSGAGSMKSEKGDMSEKSSIKHLASGKSSVNSISLESTRNLVVRGMSSENMANGDPSSQHPDNNVETVGNVEVSEQQLSENDVASNILLGKRGTSRKSSVNSIGSHSTKKHSAKPSSVNSLGSQPEKSRDISAKALSVRHDVSLVNPAASIVTTEEEPIPEQAQETQLEAEADVFPSVGLTTRLDSRSADIDSSVNLELGITGLGRSGTAIRYPQLSAENVERVSNAAQNILLDDLIPEDNENDPPPNTFEREFNMDDPLQFNMEDPLQEATESHADTSEDMEAQRPFLSLVQLDLSNNEIVDEAGLLALTAYPALARLDIASNPLARGRTAMPILKRHLELLCGIDINRKEKAAPVRERVPIETISASIRSRRVKDVLPPIKSRDIDLELTMVALENLRMLPEPPTISLLSPRKTVMSPVPEAETRECEAQPVSETRQVGEAGADEPVFLTQVDEGGVDYLEESDVYQQQGDVELEEVTEGETAKQEEIPWYLVDDADSSAPAELIPDSFTGKVKALNQILENPLVFNQPSPDSNGNPQRWNEMKKKKKKKKNQSAIVAFQLPASSTAVMPATSQSNRISQALEQIRTETNNVTIELQQALEMDAGDPRRRQFVDAAAIMKRVERKYQRVCERSLEPIRKLQNELPPPSRNGATSRLSRLGLGSRLANNEAHLGRSSRLSVVESPRIRVATGLADFGT